MITTATPLGLAYENDPAETLVSHWFTEYVEAGRARLHFPLRHIRATTTALRLLHRLPQLTVNPGEVRDGPFVRRALRSPLLVRLVLANAISVLPVPDDLSRYTTGRSKHALRQKLRAAEGAGLQYRSVVDQTERRRILHSADGHERLTAAESTRWAEADNQDLLPLDLWMVAEDAAGTPLLLAIAAVDGEVAVLRYYRTLTHDGLSRLARFGTMPRLVSTLHASGVRWVFENGRPSWIENGARQFQRKVGFRIVRVKIASR